MLILPPCLGTCSVVLLRDPIPKKVIHASKYSHPQKDRNGAYHCIYLYIFIEQFGSLYFYRISSWSGGVSCNRHPSLPTLQNIPKLTASVSDYHQNIELPHQCSQYSVVIKAVDIKTVPEDTCIKFPEPSRFECQKMLNV